MRVSPKMRRRVYYTVEKAGAMEPLGYSRTESYRAVTRGDIPVERDGRFLLVPRQKWDTKLQRLREQMRQAGLKRPRGRPPKAPQATASKARAEAVATP
jgi:hypothetical protein